MNKWLVVVIIVVLVVGGVYVYRKQRRVIIQANTAPTKVVMQPSAAPSSATNEMVPSTAVQQNTVTLTKDGVSPATLTVKVGTKVMWVNKSGVDATINSNPHPVHTDYPALNLGKFADGVTLSLTFNKAGSYGYHNHLNPSQTGTVVVQ